MVNSTGWTSVFVYEVNSILRLSIKLIKTVDEETIYNNQWNIQKAFNA